MGDDKLRVTVMGAGSWGTALGHLLARNGHRVTMWAMEPEVVAGINQQHRNPLYMKEAVLPDGLTASGDYATALSGAEMVLFVIPVQVIRQNLRSVRSYLKPGVPIVVCSKGIERQSLQTMEEVFRDELPVELHRDITVLSGPSFAAEVVRGLPTNVTVAGRDPEVTRKVQHAIASRDFRVYTTDDVTGVEIGGALKNIMAIVVGGCDELGFGHNTRAALITRGLAEITRIAVNLGGRPETMLGLAGVGDLVLTCTGDLSRNRTVGKLLARGLTLEQVKQELKEVAEGVPTTESAYQLAQKHGIDTPIIDMVYDVIYGGVPVLEAMARLQDRTLKEEWRI
jgi:glycerol-3-phosphate dehydrogenase (NAD(P)+)